MMKKRPGIVRNIALLAAAVSAPAHAQTDNVGYPGPPPQPPASALLNPSGSWNTAFGANALRNDSTGNRNTATGRNALTVNSTGSFNTANGHHALTANTSGGSNVAIGAYALALNVFGGKNTAVGFEALRNFKGVEEVEDVEGVENTAVGWRALRDNASGVANTAVGTSAMAHTTTGSGNTGVGFEALAWANGDGNTALGEGALYYAGNRSTAVGVTARGICAGEVGCDYITAMGYDAVADIQGSAFGASAKAGARGAVAVGYVAYAQGANSIAIGGAVMAGTSTVPTKASGANSIAIGSGVTATTANTVRIGNAAMTSIGGYQYWSNLSDGRYKTNIKANVPGLEFITKLEPVTFNWKLSKLNQLDGAEEFASDPALGAGREAKARKTYTGFIAQDVEAAARECGFDFSGVQRPENESSQYYLGYSEFVVPLVKAVQEQQKEIEELRKAVRALAAGGALPDGRLGAAAAPATSQHAGVLGSFWGGAMTLLSAGFVLMHLKRRRESAATR